VKSNLAVDMEVAPRSLSVAVSRWWMQALRWVLLGDNPIRTAVVEARGDQSAEVERGGSVMQPMVVLDDAAVTHPAVPRVSQAMVRSTIVNRRSRTPDPLATPTRPAASPASTDSSTAGPPCA
jgi:hypothetical protein